MYRIEVGREDGRRTRWEPLCERPTREEAEAERRLRVRNAMREARERGAFRTPRFRIVEAQQVHACAVMQ